MARYVRYVPSQTKRALRHAWDTPIVKGLYTLLGHPLSYCGLPGEAIEDLVEWKRWLGRITAVEIEERGGVQFNLQYNAICGGFIPQGFQQMRGDIDEIFLTGHDLDFQVLALDDYHIVFLDYFGGWLYKDHLSGRSKRYSAFKAMLERQRSGAEKHPGEINTFLLLLGVNVRSDDEGEVQRYTKHSLPTSLSKKHENAIRRLKHEGNEHWFLKYYVSNNIAQAASAASFSSYLFPPVYYKSTEHTAMMRFAAFLTHIPRSDAPPRQTQDINSLPLATITDTQITQLTAPKPLSRFIDRLQTLQSYITQAKAAARKSTMQTR